MEVIQGILFVTNNEGASSPSASLGSKHRAPLEVHGAILGVVSLPSLSYLRHCLWCFEHSRSGCSFIDSVRRRLPFCPPHLLLAWPSLCILPYPSVHFTLYIEVCAGQCIIIQRFDKEAWKRLRWGRPEVHE